MIHLVGIFREGPGFLSYGKDEENGSDTHDNNKWKY